MKDIIRDIKTAAGLFGEMRKARKEGSEVEVRHSMQIPYMNTEPSFLSTVEGCRLINGDKYIFQKAQGFFAGLTHEEKRMLCFSPKDGEFIDRVDFWKKILGMAMDPAQSSRVLQSIIQCYRHIKAVRK